MDWSQGIAACIAQSVFLRLFDYGGNECLTPVSRKGSFSAPSQVPAARASGLAAGRLHPSGAARRRQIARCRALRAEIAAFENEFESAHGHRPHAHDREAMSRVYEEYRTLKLNVRDDAATHIQCVFRGHRSRRRASTSHTQSHTHARAPAAAASSGSKARGPEPPSAPADKSSGIAEKLSALKSEKSGLKQKLRAFDSKFLADNGRNPSKQEKEHLRPMYQRYHELKAMISTLEAAVAGAAAPGGTAAARTVGIMRNDSTGSTGTGGAEDIDEDVGAPAASEPIAGVTGDGVDPDDDDAARPRERRTADTSASAPPQSAAVKELRNEKRRLQQFLRDYERDFEAREGRKVKFVKDIQPVLDQYTRYKHLKNILRELGAA